jgi:hypothetical protein
MRLVLFGLLVLTSCWLAEPTYRDVMPERIAEIEAILSASNDELWTRYRARLKAELSEDFGATVDKVYETKSGVIAEIAPATTDAVKEIIDSGIENPTSEANWIRATITGGLVIIAGLLGYRGRRKRSSPDPNPRKRT